MWEQQTLLRALEESISLSIYVLAHQETNMLKLFSKTDQQQDETLLANE